ncbi:MAG: methyltransferase domain-containing protein [Candidatus Woesearchaeota archaeon]
MKKDLLEKVRRNLYPGSEHIIEAMDVIDRKYFISDPYIDTAIPIGHEQTISQPSTVGRMLMLAELKKGDKVLEIGTGSGWNAALIAYIVYPGKVLSLDIISALLDKARDNIQPLQSLVPNLELKLQNIFKKPISERYDKIIITAGINPPDKSYIIELAQSNLRDKGILICPHIQGPIIILRNNEGKIEEEQTPEHYVFVNLMQ